MTDDEMANVLWIEDGALFELAHLAGPVYLTGKYNLFVASDVTEATNLICERQYQAIIVDIRLPPGSDRRWEQIYKRTGRHKSTAGLGLIFLKTVLGAPDAEITLPQVLDWIAPEKIGVLTVERYIDLRTSLDELGVHIFRQKTANMPQTTLLDLIRVASGQHAAAVENE